MDTRREHADTFCIRLPPFPSTTHNAAAAAANGTSTKTTTNTNTTTITITIATSSARVAALQDEFLRTEYATAVPLIGGMDRALDQVVGNPEGILGTVRTDQWHYDGKVVLIGDAAHAIVPFFGQVYPPPK